MSKEAWYWLASGLGYGAVNTGELLAAFPGGAEEIAADLGSDVLDELLTQKQAERLAATRPADFALRVGHAEALGLAVIGFDEEAYPAALRPIHNPPPVLFVKGDASLLNGQLSLGMVGTRRPSAYGVEAVKAIGRGVALGGAIIVSGLAAGLDAEAHKAALAVNGPTIACIAFGHDHCYPAANRKLMEIIERYGAVISEYPPGTKPEKPFFLQRNRLIAGISHGLCVVEARQHSGTMSTANFASDFGRDVFAVPGSIFSELSGGTNALIRDGAYLAGSASDVLAVYGITLKEEDPVNAAARQAQEGRPLPAGAQPPWQQGPRPPRQQRTVPAAPATQLPGQQSLGEVLRGHLPGGDGPVSAAAAVDAFRSLQKAMPATADNEVDARNAALDEMVDAVTDSVSLGGGRPGAKKKTAKGKRETDARPFAWDKVERVDKRTVEDLSPVQDATVKKGRRKPLASRVLNTLKDSPKNSPKSGQNAQAAPVAAPPYPAAPAARHTAVPTQPIERVNGVERMERMERVEPVAATTPAPAVPAVQSAAPPAAPPPRQNARAAAYAAAAAPVSQPGFTPRAVGDIPTPPPQMDAALEERLRTLKAPPLPKARPRAPQPGDTAAALPAGAPAQADGAAPPRQAVPDVLEHLPATPPPPKPPLGRSGSLHTAAPIGAGQTGPGTAAANAALAGPLPAPQAHTASTPEATDPADPHHLLSEVARRAYQQLGVRPVSLAELCEKSSLSSAEAMAALTELELAGLSRQLPGRQFVIMD